MRRFLALLLTMIFLLSSSGCGAGQVLGPTLTPTQTSTATPTLTPTATSTPTPTPIPTPSVEVGLRPENATTQVYENGIWTVKNADGLVTATWNKETNNWEYIKENIKVEQVLIGYDMDRSLVEPYLGPLPPDDPSTHFIDQKTGKRVDYGIGPDIKIGVMSMTEGKYEIDGNILYVRFRGAAPIIDNRLREPMSTLIFDIPQSIDRSIIILVPTTNHNIAFRGLAGNIADLEFKNYIVNKAWAYESGLQMAKDHLVGSMFMIMITHGETDVSTDSEASVHDQRAHAILDFIAGRRTTPPLFSFSESEMGILTLIYVPETQLPPH